MTEDRIRVLRVIEYIGPRSLVEEQVARSIHGTARFHKNRDVEIRAATIGAYPEVLEKAAAVDFVFTAPVAP